jgi:hypothetical protein
MSQDFCVTMACPLDEVLDVLLRCADSMRALGYLPDESVTLIDWDEHPGRVVEDRNIPFANLAKTDAVGWNGVSGSFTSAALTLDVVVVSHGTFLNIFVEVSAKSLANAFRTQNMDSYFNAVVQLAMASRSSGGIGGYDLDPNAIPPDGIISMIQHNPYNRGYPADLGLVPRAAMRRDVVSAFAGKSFRVAETADFWLLVGHEFLTLLHEWP